MTSSIPDSFSLDELSNMLENAPHEEDLRAQHSDDCPGCPECEATPERIEDIANEALDFAASKCDDPLVHKVIAMKVMHNMIQWHKHVAIRQLNEGNEASMGAWMRDAGKFQAVMDILTSVTVGPDDFTCDHE